ncbi:Bystin [Manis pentadactyla]|nr:Bystin [Manis pentadactyla]
MYNSRLLDCLERHRAVHSFYGLDVNMGLITESCANSAVLVEVQEYEVLSYILSSNLITKGLRNGYKIKQIFEEDFKLLMVVEFHSLIFLPQEKKEIKHFPTNSSLSSIQASLMEINKPRPKAEGSIQDS